VVNDLYNVPTPADPQSVLMRYLPQSQAGATLSVRLSDEADYGYHALTEGDRLFILKKWADNANIQAVEYDPASHSPIGSEATMIKVKYASVPYSALTMVDENVFHHILAASTSPGTAPWSAESTLYLRAIGTSSIINLGKSAGYNHLLNDGFGGDSPYAAFITSNPEGLCPNGDYLYYFQKLEINSAMNGVNMINLDGACDDAAYFSDLTSIVHSFAMDEDGLYIARSNGDTAEVYRIDRDDGLIQMLYRSDFYNQRRALVIDVSHGYVLMHSFDRNDFNDNEVILLNTKNTSVVEDDEMETITLPATGIPMNLQVMVTP
jgi:hypothetical protein